MSANEVNLIECSVIFDGPEFFNTLSHRRTFREIYSKVDLRLWSRLHSPRSGHMGVQSIAVARLQVTRASDHRASPRRSALRSWGLRADRHSCQAWFKLTRSTNRGGRSELVTATGGLPLTQLSFDLEALP